MKKLNSYRKKIDSIDERLLKLLNQRAKVVQKIQKIKSKSKIQTYDPRREKEILQRLEELNRGPLLKHDIQKLFRQIIRFFRQKQKDSLIPSPGSQNRGAKVIKKI